MRPGYRCKHSDISNFGYIMKVEAIETATALKKLVSVSHWIESA
jgi:hypothetical protein